MNREKAAVTLLFLLMSYFINGQTSISNTNVITTAVPFLSNNPDPRGGGMGDAGVATSPNVFSQNFNPAKYAFYKPQESPTGNLRRRYIFLNDTTNYGMEYEDYLYGDSIDSLLIESLRANEKIAIGASFSPWMNPITNGSFLLYLAGMTQVYDNLFLSSSIRYFTPGEIAFTSDYGEFMGNSHPKEFAIDLAISKKLSNSFSGAIAFRYIHSDITGGQLISGVESKPGVSYASDVAFFYNKKLENDNSFLFGINIQNVGSKISYTAGEQNYFIPTTLKIGSGYVKDFKNGNFFQFTLEANKLLVPTPHITSIDFEDDAIIYPGGSFSDKSSIAGVFSSFTDAPGGLKEELKEISLLVGSELEFDERFQFRIGYFHESKDIGNRKFFTFGTGFIIKQKSKIDFSYLVLIEQDHPLANIIRASYSISF